MQIILKKTIKEKIILDKLVKLKDSSKAKVFQSLLNEYGWKEISKYSNNFDHDYNDNLQLESLRAQVCESMG